MRGIAESFHGNPVSGNQPCKRIPTSTDTMKELQMRNLHDPMPTMTFFEGWEGEALNLQNSAK